MYFIYIRLQVPAPYNTAFVHIACWKDEKNKPTFIQIPLINKLAPPLPCASFHGQPPPPHSQPSTRPSIHRRVRSYKMCTAPSLRYEIRSKWGLNDCRIDLPARLISVIQLYLAGGAVGKVSSSSLLHFLLHQLSERSLNSAHVSFRVSYIFLRDIHSK